MSEAWSEVDPFELPEWLGTDEVLWRACDGASSAHHLTVGELVRPGGQVVGCDLAAIDEAYPAPVAPEAVRQRVHLAWRSGEVALLAAPDGSGRLTLGVTGCTLDAAVTMEAIARLARAVGTSPARWSVQWRLAGRGGRR